jgi:hypothetical protein
MRHRLASLVAICLLVCGCDVSSEPAVPAPTTTSKSQLPVEVAWVEQLAAVRAGEATRIAVSHSTVTREQWHELRTGCESLSRLEIDAADITDADLDVLASLPALTLLKLGSEVGDDGIRLIARVETLEVLNLPEGRFHDDALSLLTTLPRLKQLRFHSPNVGDEGLRIIATLPALKYLHIIACPITADGLAHLHAMTELQSFYLDGCDIEDEAIYALLDALPSLHFHRDQLHLPDDRHGHEH